MPVELYLLIAMGLAVIFLLPLNETLKLAVALVGRVPVIGFNVGVGDVLKTFHFKGIPFHLRSLPLFWSCKIPLALDENGQVIPDMTLTETTKEEQRRMDDFSLRFAKGLPLRCYAPHVLSPFLCFMVGMFVMTVGFRHTTRLKEYATAPIVKDIQVASFEEKAGILSGDRVISVNGQVVTTFDDIIRRYHESKQKGAPVHVILERKKAKGEPVTVTVDLPSPTRLMMSIGPGRTAGKVPTWGDAAYLSVHAAYAIVSGWIGI